MRRDGLWILVLVAVGAGCGRESAEKVVDWTGGSPRRGKELVRQFGCSSCHTIPGVPGADGLVGPPLTHIASRAYIGGKLVNTPDNMRGFIARPHGAEPNIAMPEMGIPDQDVRDIAAYLYTLR